MKKFLYKTSLWALAVILSTAVINIGGLVFDFLPTQKARASALSLICANSSAANNTAACSGQAANDLLLVFAFRSGNATAPTLPGGWNGIGTGANGGGGTNSSVRTGWKNAASSSEGSGTWTNATHVVMHVYRGHNSSSPIGNFAEDSPNSTSNIITYPAVNLSVTDGSSWFAGFGGRAVAHADVATAPSGMTNRTSAGATPNASGHDINGPTSSNWSSTTVTIGGSASKPNGWVIEIKAAPVVTVGTTGTQVSTLSIPTTDGYVGGAFTFVRDVGTTDVTQIIVTETGTVDANTNLSNVDIRYETAGTCTFDGSETLFGTAAAFSSSQATVTGTMSVGTSQVCVYVVVDVGSGASGGDTLEIEISNPSTEVTVAAGAVTPASAVAISGTTTLTVAGPATEDLMRHGNWFSSGAEQGFFWVN